MTDMRAAWYGQHGPPQVLNIGDLPQPVPQPGEVRVELRYSGVNPGDVKKRQGWLGFPMPYPRVIPHSDGSGFIDAVGDGVPPSRLGQRVWVYGAQSYRPFGTAAQWTTVPEAQAVQLPDAVSDEVGATLGIPGITAHRAVFGDGQVAGQAVLIHGVLGAVGSFACQLATAAGAVVVATVRTSSSMAQAAQSPVAALVALDDPDAATAVRAVAPSGVDRIVEVSLSDNVNFDSQVIAAEGVIAAYGSAAEQPTIPFWPLLFANASVRLLGSDDFPATAKSAAATALTHAAATGHLKPLIRTVEPLRNITAAHAAVENGREPGRVLVRIGPL